MTITHVCFRAKSVVCGTFERSDIVSRVRSVMVGVASVALAFALTCCGKTETKPVQDEEPTAVTETVQEPEEALEEEESADVESEPTEDVSAEEGTTEVVQRIGSPEYGYVSVPSTWVKFVDTDGNTSVQYCDPSASYIVSLNIFDLSNASDEERASFGAYEGASSVWANIEDDGGQDVTGATVTLAGREAYQVYAYFPDDGTFLVTWCVADDAGVVHYVAAEGPGDGLMDLVTLVEQTYSFTEQ